MDNFYYKHYITFPPMLGGTSAKILNGFSTAFKQPQLGDICINEQGGYQFKIMSNAEENSPLTDQNGCHLYRWENEQVRKTTQEELDQELIEIQTPTLNVAKSNKLSEISQACNTTIISGCDATLTDGITGHISLTSEDQINLNGAKEAVNSGILQYPYHLDGQLCELYNANDINILAKAAIYHKLYHTTLCNHYNIWIRRCETVNEIQSITYGCNLPTDLAEHMQGLLNNET